jgi:hypothetical protein
VLIHSWLARTVARAPFGELKISPIQNMIHFPIKTRKNEQEITKINFFFHTLIRPIQ